MKLVAYVRVSSEGQKENTSLSYQYERIEKYCEYHNHEIYVCARDVETASGKRRRPGLELARNTLAAGDADGIICLKLDRFARNVIEGLQMAMELKKQNKQLVIIDLNLDTSTPMGQCMFTMLLAFAELEHQTIRERIQSGQEKVRQMDGYVWGRRPYGYQVIKEGNRKILVRDPGEYYWLTRMRTWLKFGWSLTQIHRELIRLEVPTQGGGQWSYGSVRRILKETRSLAEWAEELHLERTDDDPQIKAKR